MDWIWTPVDSCFQPVQYYNSLTSIVRTLAQLPYKRRLSWMFISCYDQLYNHCNTLWHALYFSHYSDSSYTASDTIFLLACLDYLAYFCHAMLCIARLLPACSVRLSFVSCAKKNKDIFEFFSPCGSQAILVFPYQTGWHYSNGNPANGGIECKGGMKKLTIFDQYLAVSQKRL